MPTKLLPHPGLTRSAMLTYQDKYACGYMAIDLSAFLSGQTPPLQGPRYMPSVFLRHVFPCILPLDMERNLRHLGLRSQSLVLAQEEAVGTLKGFIDQNRCIITYVGVGVGHWLTVWGYDDKNQVFFVFDSGKDSKGRRDQNQLTRYPYQELTRMMFTEVWTQKLGKLVSGFYPRLLASPGTVVVAHADQ